MLRPYQSKLATGERGALLALVLCALIAGCGVTTSGQTNATSASPTNTAAAPTQTTQPQPTTPPPTPFPAGAFVTYTNTAYHYSIRYPGNWLVDKTTTPTSDIFIVQNFNNDPQQFQTYLPLPLFKVQVTPMSNPSHMAPLDFLKQQMSQPGQAGPPLTIASSQTVQVAGRDAVEVVLAPQADSGTYPMVDYLVPNGDTLFGVMQNNAQNGQPAPVFAQMVASFVTTG